MENQNKYSKIKLSYTCPFNMIDDLIGGKWKLRIVSHIINGDNRFSMLEKSINDISPKVLMSQLKELEASGLIIRKVLKEEPPKIVVYEINSDYKALEPLVLDLQQFAVTYGTKNKIKICNNIN